MYSKQPVRSALALALACWLCCGIWSPGSAAAQELPPELEALPGFDLIPSGSHLAVVIPDVARLRAKLALLNEKLDLDDAGMADVLEEFRRASGMRRGLLDEGPIVMSMSVSSSASNRPPALWLMPVADYAKFVEDLGGNPADETPTLTTSWGQTIYCKESQGHAVLSARKRIVTGYQPRTADDGFAKSVGAFAARHLATSDAAIVVDVAAVRPVLESQLQAMMAMREEAGADAPGATSKVAAAAEETASAAVKDAFAGMLADTEMAALCLDINADGIGVTVLGKFHADSTMGAMFAQRGAASEGDLLTQFPVGDHLMAQSLDFTSFRIAKVLDAVKAGLVERDLKWLADVIDSQVPVELFAKIKRASLVHYAPDQLSLMTRAGRPHGAVLIEADDARGFAAAVRAYVDSLDGTTLELPALPGASGKVDPDAPPVKVKIVGVYTPRSQVVDGVPIDQFEVTYETPFALMSAVGPPASIALDAMREHKGFVAVVDQNVIVTLTDDDQLLKKMLTAVRQNRGLGKQPGLLKVSRNLPADAAYRGYFNVADLLKSAAGGLSLFLPISDQQTAAFDKVPPIGWSLVVDPQGAAKRLFLPMDLMRPVIPVATLIYEMQTDPNMGPEIVDEGGFGQPTRGTRTRRPAAGRPGPPGRGTGGRPFMPGPGGGGFGPPGR